MLTDRLGRSLTRPVEALVRAFAHFSPDVLNLSSNGNYVKMTIQLPEDLDPYDIRLSSVMLLDAVPALEQPAPSYGDVNGDGITDVSFKFDRLAVEALLPVGQEVPVSIQGEVEDVQWWRGSDTIRTMHPRITAPNGADYLHSGSVTTGSYEFFLGSGEEQQVRDTLRPSEQPPVRRFGRPGLPWNGLRARGTAREPAIGHGARQVHQRVGDRSPRSPGRSRIGRAPGSPCPPR